MGVSRVRGMSTRETGTLGQPPEDIGWCVPGVGVRRADGSELPSRPAFAEAREVDAPADVEDLVAALRVVSAGLGTVRGGLTGLPDEAVAELMLALGETSVAVETMTLETTVAALERDIPRSGPRALSPVDWVRTHHLGLRGTGAARMVQAAALVRADTHCEITAGLRSGALPVATAALAHTQIGTVMGALPAHTRTPEVRDAVAAAIVGAAATGSPREVRAVAMELISTYAGPESLDRVADRAHSQRELSTPATVGDGLYEYRWRTDALGMATVEAALDPLTALTPLADGRPDLRSARQRRADALATLIETAIAAPDSPASGIRGQLHLTMTLDALASALHDHHDHGDTTDRAGDAGSAFVPSPQPTCSGCAATTTDPTAHGSVIGQSGAAASATLSPTQVRILACSAGIIPTVLGSDGTVVDQGHQVHLFPPHHVRQMWLRDNGCTLPGCTMPAKWTQAHHLTWHRHHGPTALANGALLCSHHHHTVHTRALHGWVDPATDTVHWNLTPGSYDTARRDSGTPGTSAA